MFNSAEGSHLCCFIIITSDVLEHKSRVSLKLHYCYMIDFNF